jgi:MurNAc alpha-1-phosphate uridylyltransferase
LQESFFVMYGDSYLPVDLGPIWQTSEQGQVATMAVLRNEGRWDKSNVIFRNATLLLYDKFAGSPATLDMDYIDFGLSVLTREAIIQGIASGSKLDLAYLFNQLSLQGRLRGHEVEQRFYEIGSPQGLDDFEAYLRTAPGIGRLV